MHASEILTLSERGQDSSPRPTAFDQVLSVNSASGGGVISVETITSSAAVTMKIREGEEEFTPEGRLDKPNQRGEEEEPSSFDLNVTAAVGQEVAVSEKKTMIAGMNPVVAAAKAARDARHTQDIRGRLITPMVVERLHARREPRQQFNFDSTRAPSSGMLGAGLAVPRGFADARLSLIHI